jgi:hypothetical protein
VVVDRDPVAPTSPAQGPETVAVIDIGASAVRLVVAELAEGRRPLVVEEVVRGVSLGKDTFSAGRIGSGAMGPRSTRSRLPPDDEHGASRYRAVATSAVREAANADTFLDRVQVRIGLRVDVIDVSEESRLVYLAVQECLTGHPALAGSHALLVEVGGGSADITLLEGDRPKYSGVYALGSVRLRRASALGGHRERRVACWREHRECPARHRSRHPDALRQYDRARRRRPPGGTGGRRSEGSLSEVPRTRSSGSAGGGELRKRRYRPVRPLAGRRRGSVPALLVHARCCW